jgi:hypothetical protein
MKIFQQVYEAFKFVIEKEITVKTTRAIKIEAGLTIQLKKHKTNTTKNYIQNTNDPSDYVCYDIFMVIRVQVTCYRSFIYFQKMKKRLKNI